MSVFAGARDGGGETSTAPETEIAYSSRERVPDFELVRKSGLFDRRYYWRQLRKREIYQFNVNPIEHYFEHGEAMGLSPNPLFDSQYYYETYPDVAASGIPALIHYVSHGDAEGRNPHPLFDCKFVRRQLGPDFLGNTLETYLRSRGPELQPHSKVDVGYIWEQQQRLAPSDNRPCLVFFLEHENDELNPSDEFNSFNYRLLNPDIRGFNPFYHYIRYGIADRRATTKAKYSVSGILKQVEEVSRIEPDVVDIFAARIATLPWQDLHDVKRVEYLLSARLSMKCGTRKYAHVILAPWLKRGGAERVIANLIAALLSSAATDNILILCTQSDVIDARTWLPFTPRVSVVMIHDVIDNTNPAYVSFCNWLQFFECRYLYVVNSAFGWELVSKYGRSLRSLLTTFGFVFCYDYDEFDRRVGYAWTHLRRALPDIDALVSENARAIDQFCEDQFLDASDRAKFHCLYQPVDPVLKGRVVAQIRHNLRVGGGRRQAVLWAARFDRQKGIELALEIATGLPELDFLFFGGSMAELPRELPELPDNARIEGPFEEFASLPLHEFSLFLHTSHWDGLPNVLLEAGAAGLPVLATDVGGVAELIDDKTGWLVAHRAGAAAYQEQIKRMIANPDEAVARCERLAERIDARHSTEGFLRETARLLEDVAAGRLRAASKGD